MPGAIGAFSCDWEDGDDCAAGTGTGAVGTLTAASSTRVPQPADMTPTSTTAMRTKCRSVLRWPRTIVQPPRVEVCADGRPWRRRYRTDEEFISLAFEIAALRCGEPPAGDNDDRPADAAGSPVVREVAQGRGEAAEVVTPEGPQLRQDRVA